MANEDNTIHANMRIVMSHLQLNAANCPKQKPLFPHSFVHFESCLQIISGREGKHKNKISRGIGTK